MTSIILTMIRSAKRVAGTRKKKNFWLQQIRPLMFILQFLVLFAFIVVYRGANFEKQVTSKHDRIV